MSLHCNSFLSVCIGHSSTYFTELDRVRFSELELCLVLNWNFCLVPKWSICLVLNRSFCLVLKWSASLVLNWSFSLVSEMERLPVLNRSSRLAQNWIMYVDLKSDVLPWLPCNSLAVLDYEESTFILLKRYLPKTLHFLIEWAPVLRF
jgi:hypothetical protein